MSAYAYLPPSRPADHPEQCYYRASDFSHSMLPWSSDTKLVLFRWARESVADLKLGRSIDGLDAEVSVRLDAATLRTLHAALSDALQDIEAAEADRELQESFDRISDEMRDAGEDGPGCYYAHPDIHYVDADRVQAKVVELEAAGCKRYMVLPHPRAEAADDASDTPPRRDRSEDFPERDKAEEHMQRERDHVADEESMAHWPAADL